MQTLDAAAGDHEQRLMDEVLDLALVEAARGEVDEAKRLAMFEQAQVIFKRERPWITMAHSSVYIPLRRDVQGFVMALATGLDATQVELATTGREV